jgi:hypothetical protein
VVEEAMTISAGDRPLRYFHASLVADGVTLARKR